MCLSQVQLTTRHSSAGCQCASTVVTDCGEYNFSALDQKSRFFLEFFSGTSAQTGGWDYVNIYSTYYFFVPNLLNRTFLYILTCGVAMS